MKFDFYMDTGHASDTSKRSEAVDIVQGMQEQLMGEIGKQLGDVDAPCLWLRYGRRKVSGKNFI